MKLNEWKWISKRIRIQVKLEMVGASFERARIVRGKNRSPNGINSRSKRVAVTVGSQRLLQQFGLAQDQCLFLLKLPLLLRGCTPMSGVNDQDEED